MTRREYMLHPSWNHKFLAERRRKRDSPKEILPLENAFMLAKLEGIILYQGSLLEKLTELLRQTTDDVDGYDITNLIRRDCLEEIITLVKNVTPKEETSASTPVKDASKYFVK